MPRPTVSPDGTPSTSDAPSRRWPIAVGVAALAVAGAAVPVIASASDSPKTVRASDTQSVAGPAKSADGPAAVVVNETVPSTTVAPTTAAPTTVAPTTAAPTTAAPTTAPATTAAPQPSPAAVAAVAAARAKAEAHDAAVATWYAAARRNAVERYRDASQRNAVLQWNAAVARNAAQKQSGEAARTAAWYRAAASARPTTRSTPAPAPRAAAPQSSAPSVAGGSVWDRIAQCESGGNWSISTGNGFYGGLQFTLSSWRGVGGSGMPNQASRETQIQMGQRLQAQQGWGAWPVCSHKAGAR